MPKRTSRRREEIKLLKSNTVLSKRHVWGKNCIRHVTENMEEVLRRLGGEGVTMKEREWRFLQ